MTLYSYKAVVMIPRAPIKAPQRPEEALSHGKGGDEDGGPSMPAISLDTSAAMPLKKSTKRVEVKTRDWRASIQAYNRL